MSKDTVSVPAVVRNKALAVGAEKWLENLPQLVADIEREWSITVGAPYPDPTEAFVARATMADGTPAVLKLMIDRPTGDARNEITVLDLTNGEGCAELYRSDVPRSALLLERLGPSLNDLQLPDAQQREILCMAAARVWRRAPNCGLPTGADKGRALIEFITNMYEELDHPCTQRAVDYAVECAERRIAAHDNERARLLHGDVHQWNTLQANGGFKLVDPDGLLAEPEYDLGVMLREDPPEEDPRARAQWLADFCHLDVTAVWEWGAVERVSTGLLCTRVGVQPGGGTMLAVADRVATTEV